MMYESDARVRAAARCPPVELLLAAVSAVVIGVPPRAPRRTGPPTTSTAPSPCSDAGAGTTDTPFCTITKAVAALRAGDTVYIGNGSYAETVKPARLGDRRQTR